MWRILAVEDSQDARRLIESALDGACEIAFAGSLLEARESLAAFRPDLVLLDLGLPDGHGFELCSAIGAGPTDPPVVFLTARCETGAKVAAFSLGAEDYVEKPFDPRELRARVEGRLRRREAARRGERYRVAGTVRVDRERFRAYVLEPEGERELQLTPHELEILHHLLAREGDAVGRRELMAAVWGATVVSQRTIDTHVGNLRRKLGAAAVHLETVRGIGYRFSSGAPPSAKRGGA